MKLNKNIILRIILLAIACIFAITLSKGLFAKKKKQNLTPAAIDIINYSRHWPYDMSLRVNEILCMHDGIDPFDVFERKITTEKYSGFHRPDMPREPHEGKKYVHAYTPWHATVFWWFGSVPEYICIVILTILFFGSLIWSCKWVYQTLSKHDAPVLKNGIVDNIENILFLLAVILNPICGIISSYNYGLLLLCCMLLLFTAIECNHEFIAGILFSIIMIKPQIGLMLVIPLLLSKKYKTIAIAATICIIETFLPAYKLDKSMVELILEIPKIGAPFPKGFFTETVVNIVGPTGQYIIMVVFIGMATIGCYLVQNAKEFWMRVLPALAVIPFWTYSQFHDLLVTVPCYIYLLNSKNKYPRIYNLCICMTTLRLFLMFAHLQQWYFIGKQSLITLLHLTTLLICCLLDILDVNGNTMFLNLVNKFKYREKGKENFSAV